MTQTTKKDTNELTERMLRVLKESQDAYMVANMWFDAGQPKQYRETVLRVLIRAAHYAHMFLKYGYSTSGETQNNNTEGQNGRAHH